MPRIASNPVGVFEGVPTFFRACCLESQCLTPIGYAHAGRHLTGHVEGLIPFDVSFDEWETIISRLRHSIAVGNDRAILKWFCKHYPACMSLVPRRRRDTFLKGVYDVAQESWGIEPKRRQWMGSKEADQ
jgi:hypothetical protein